MSSSDVSRTSVLFVVCWLLLPVGCEGSSSPVDDAQPSPLSAQLDVNVEKYRFPMELSCVDLP